MKLRRKPTFRIVRKGKQDYVQKTEYTEKGKKKTCRKL